jgi:hypothetical protein
VFDVSWAARVNYHGPSKKLLLWRTLKKGAFSVSQYLAGLQGLNIIELRQKLLVWRTVKNPAK